MTREDREDAINIIQSILDKYEEDECLVTEITIGDEDIKAFKMAIKALEQEPVLDKIRAEIEQLRNFRAENYDLEQYCDCFDARIIFRDDVFKILDKYKTESEN